MPYQDSFIWNVCFPEMKQQHPTSRYLLSLSFKQSYFLGGNPYQSVKCSTSRPVSGAKIANFLSSSEMSGIISKSVARHNYYIVCARKLVDYQRSK